MKWCVLIMVALVASVASGVARFTFASPATRIWLDALFLFSTTVVVVGAVTLVATYGGGRLMQHFHHHETPWEHDHRTDDDAPSS